MFLITKPLTNKQWHKQKKLDLLFKKKKKKTKKIKTKRWTDKFGILPYIIEHVHDGKKKKESKNETYIQKLKLKVLGINIVGVVTKLVWNVAVFIIQ